MRVWTMLLSLIVACLMAVNLPAQESKPPAKKHPLLDRFEKLDTNHDGILTAEEFAAAHQKHGDKAKTVFQALEKLGGTTTKDGVTGMTFQEFKKAHLEWKKTHPGKAPPTT